MTCGTVAAGCLRISPAAVSRRRDRLLAVDSAVDCSRAAAATSSRSGCVRLLGRQLREPLLAQRDGRLRQTGSFRSRGRTGCCEQLAWCRAHTWGAAARALGFGLPKP